MKYICNICNKEYSQKSHYISHINKKNKCNIDDLYINGKKIYKCNICNKVFNMKSSYVYHINKKNKCSETFIPINVIDVKSSNNDLNNIFNDVNITKNKTPQNSPQIPQNSPQIPQNSPQIPQNSPQNYNIIIDDNKCKFCQKKFSRIDNCKRHQLKCNLKNNILINNNDHIKYDNIDLNSILTTKNKIDDNILNIINKLENKIKEQNKKIIELSKNNSIISSNNNIQNNSNNNNSNNSNNNNNIITNNNNSNNTITTNNTINIVNHGKEDLSKLIKDEIKDILNSGYNSIFKSVLYTHFNDRLPEFKNIKYNDLKSSYCKICIDGKWKIAKFESTIEEMINKHFIEVTDLYNDNKCLIDSKYKDEILAEYLDDYNKFNSYETNDIYPENWQGALKSPSPQHKT